MELTLNLIGSEPKIGSESIVKQPEIRSESIVKRKEWSTARVVVWLFLVLLAYVGVGTLIVLFMPEA